MSGFIFATTRGLFYRPLGLKTSAFRPEMKGGCRQRSPDFVIFQGELKVCLYGETTVSVHAADYSHSSPPTQRQARPCAAGAGTCSQFSLELLQRAVSQGVGTEAAIHLGLRFPSVHEGRRQGRALPALEHDLGRRRRICLTEKTGTQD